jgi:general secretion pathway protein M
MNWRQHIEPVQRWLDSLQPRERLSVIAGAIALIIMLFYLLIWDPVFARLQTARENVVAQKQMLGWMQDSAREIRSLQSAGGISPHLLKQPVSTLVTMSAQSMGVQNYVTRLDTTKDGVDAQLDNADFDRVVLWLNDLQTRYGIRATRIVMDPRPDPGAINARISLERKA